MKKSFPQPTEKCLTLKIFGFSLRHRSKALTYAVLLKEKQ